jgi:hypothetical protein
MLLQCIIITSQNYKINLGCEKKNIKSLLISWKVSNFAGLLKERDVVQ